MKFSMIFESVDRATKGIKKIMDAEKKLGKVSKVGQGKTAQAAAATTRSHNQLRASMGRVRQASARTYEAIVRGAKGATRAVGNLHRKTIALGKSGLGNIGQGLVKMKGGLMTAASMFGIATGGAALAAHSMVDVAAKFEKFQTILETTEGSSEKAKKAMSWVSTFAVKTPYELDAVMESFVRMRANGLDPTNGSLKVLGDTSAAMGKPLMQAVEAMADAVTGENERLKEFGIKASKTGKIISYEYTNAAGKTAIATAKAGDRMAIQQTLMKIWGDKFGGSMQKLSATWEGMMANLSDLWLKFQLMIMQSGVFDWMKGKLQLLLDTINRMEADGTLQEWATKIGNSIILALEAAWKMAVGVYAVAKQVGGFLSKAAEWVGGWGRLAAILGSIAFAPTLLATGQGLFIVAKGVAMLGAALMANPIGLAIAAIAAGAALIYYNWDTIAPYFKAIWDTIKTYALVAWDVLKTIFAWSPLGLIVMNWGTISEALTGPITTAKDAIVVVWDTIKALFAWVPSFGDWSLPTLDWSGLKAAWDGIKALFAWVPTFAAWSLPTLNWTALKLAWDGIKALFTWVPSFGDWSMPSLTGWISGNESAATAIDKHRDALSGFAGSTSEAIAALSKLDAAQKNRVSFDANEGLAAAVKQREQHFAAMSKINYSGWNFDEGIKLVAQLKQGEIALDQFQQKLMKIQNSGGSFSGEAKQMLQESFKLDEVQRQAQAFQKTLDNIAATKQKIAAQPKVMAPAGPAAATVSQSPAELNRIGAAAKGAQASMASLTTTAKTVPAAAQTATAAAKTAQAALTAMGNTAKGIPMVVQSAMSQVNSVLGSVSLVGQGQRIMQTLADGMASRASAVVAQVAAVTQKVRDHLPSSPAKTGPLSDLHKLKFAETIAGSIKSDPMVKAMTKVTAATLMATAPLSQVSAGVAPVPKSATGASLQPSRAVQSYQAQAQSRAETRGTSESKGNVTLHYNPSLQISGDAKSAEGSFKKQLQEHSREIKRMMDEQGRQTNRRKH